MITEKKLQITGLIIVSLLFALMIYNFLTNDFKTF